MKIYGWTTEPVLKSMFSWGKFLQETEVLDATSEEPNDPNIIYLDVVRNGRPTLLPL